MARTPVSPADTGVGSTTMPLSVPTSMDGGGRAYPGNIPRQAHGGASEAPVASGDRSSRSTSRGRPTPTAGDALPMNGGSQSKVRRQGSRQDGMY